MKKKKWAVKPSILTFNIVHEDRPDEFIIKFPFSLSGRPTLRRDGDAEDEKWAWLDDGDEVLCEHRKSMLVCNAGGTLSERKLNEEELNRAIAEATVL